MHQVRMRICWLLAIFACALTFGCKPSGLTSYPDKAPVIKVVATTTNELNQHKVAIYVTSNGWHSGIVLFKPLLPRGTIPEVEDFPDALYLSFGWGDSTYYQSPTPTFGMALRAALLPTSSVVHMSGLTAHPRDVFANAEIVELHLSTEQFHRLVSYLNVTFARQTLEHASLKSKSRHLVSYFYPATGMFHLFNTCNTWTARGLQQAGLPIRVSGTFSAEDLMTQVRQFALQ